MHVDLSPHLHTDECNVLISELKTCFNDNKFMKFFLVCDEFEIKVEKCLRRERIARQKLHNETASKENALRREKIKQRSDDEL